MRFDRRYMSMRSQAKLAQRDAKYHALTDMPSEVRRLTAKGDVLGLLKVRTYYWRVVRRKIGTQAMHAMFDGLTGIKELIDFDRNLTEEKAQNLRLASAFNQQ